MQCIYRDGTRVMAWRENTMDNVLRKEIATVISADKSCRIKRPLWAEYRKAFKEIWMQEFDGPNFPSGT